MLTYIVSSLAILFVFAATLPVIMGVYQYVVLAFSFAATHLEKCKPHWPRVAVLIPAWNEDAVIEVTIDRLMALDYPADRLRVYVVDDASTDLTPIHVIRKAKQYPDRVFHIRRVAGGEGKAHTLNYGLEALWRNDWTEALLIMDADVLYTSDSLRRMARHLSDPGIGAVTAYIKEGSQAPNYVQRFIGFEYITATGASRRAQNVLGFLACLSGGAQLHSRENLQAIGGKIFSHTLAEDTFTTFRTQLAGRKAIFEPHALVYAEEPDGLVGLWKQRVRWARGNVQITRVFWRLWFNEAAHGSMGSASMGLLWFSIFLMPAFQILASISLLTLYFLDAPLAWTLFQGLWIVAAASYVAVTLVSFVIDPESARRTWVEGWLFPGLISLALILYALVPPLVEPLASFIALPAESWGRDVQMVMLYAWLSLAMLVSWLSKELERWGYPRLAKVALYLGGYGSFLCAVTLGSYAKEWMGASMTWDKTVKTGKVA